jgi:hypothetical protein
MRKTRHRKNYEDAAHKLALSVLEEPDRITNHCCAQAVPPPEIAEKLQRVRDAFLESVGAKMRPPFSS